jgi:dipeptidyl aminopeptidase/acylaminoacyl peptidase
MCCSPTALFRCGIACSLLAFTPPAVFAQAAANPTTSPTKPGMTEVHFPTNEDLRHFKAIGDPLLSPDGKLVLFTVMDATADDARSHLWLVSSSASEQARQITFSPPDDKHGEHSAQWSPDGSAIYFLAKRGEHAQLFRLDMRGGEAAPYDLKILPPVDQSKEKDAIPPPGYEKDAAKKSADSKKDDKKADDKPEPLPLDIDGFAPSPDGKWLAVRARDPQTPGEKKQKDAKADASWVNHEVHVTRLYLAGLKPDGSVDGDLRPVAVAPEVHAAVWSPAPGQDRLLVIAEPPNDVSDLGPAKSAWLVDASAPDQPVRLDGVSATVGNRAAWRPDGGEIVFAAQTPEDAPPGYDELFALAVPGPATARSLSSGFAGQFRGSALFYGTDGNLVAEAGVGSHSTPERLALDGKSAPVPVDLGAAVVTELNTNRRQTGWVWTAESGDQPIILCYAQRLGDACTHLPTPDLAPDHLRFVKPQLVRWPAAAGGSLTIEGLLYLPETANPSAKVPLIVDVHGGPMGAFEDREDPFAAFLVGHGWAVLRPNPRGSSNYGVKFAAANKNDLGGGDYQDIMAGVDAVLAKYPLDPARMALIGYSYGGEMAGFVEGKTDRFKAIVSGAPVIDQFSEYGTEGGSWYDRWYYGKPWERMEDAWRQSPLAGAAHSKTPLLLLQGESDTTDPLGQAQEMYRALRQEGVPVELVTYPREDHGPLAGGIFGYPVAEPWHGFDARQRIVQFIEKAFSAPASKP